MNSDRSGPPTLEIRLEGLQGQCWQWDAPPGQTLLQSAAAAGILLPRMCQNGTCRACRCRLLQGRIRYRIEWPGISADEQGEGWILPCVAEPVAAD